MIQVKKGYFISFYIYIYKCIYFFKWGNTATFGVSTLEHSSFVYCIRLDMLREIFELFWFCKIRKVESKFYISPFWVKMATLTFIIWNNIIARKAIQTEWTALSCLSATMNCFTYFIFTYFKPQDVLRPQPHLSPVQLFPIYLSV